MRRSSAALLAITALIATLFVSTTSAQAAATDLRGYQIRTPQGAHWCLIARSSTSVGLTTSCNYHAGLQQWYATRSTRQAWIKNKQTNTCLDYYGTLKACRSGDLDILWQWTSERGWFAPWSDYPFLTGYYGGSTTNSSVITEDYGAAAKYQQTWYETGP